MTYAVLVFLHVLGATGVFAAFGIEAVALYGLRRESVPDTARTWLGLFTVAARTGLISMVVLFVAGVALMITVWHAQPWISFAFAGMIVMGVVGGVVSGRRLRSLRASAAAENGPELSEAFRHLRSSPALASALVVRIAIAAGIVGLMTAKPGPQGSALILFAAALTGAVLSVPFASGPSQTQTPVGTP